MASFADGNFPNFKAYISHMRKPGSWGDHLTLTAIAHLTLRPVRVISDTSVLPPVINPPEFITDILWKPEVVVVHHGEFHFEATAPISHESVNLKTGVGSHSNIQSTGVLPAKSLLRRTRDASSTSVQ
eukprot:8427590-Pyramimonas_sp.AAC.1